MQLERVVSAVGDEDDGLTQVRMQGGQDGQTRGARQGQAGNLLPGLHVSQETLIGRECADFGEEEFHIL